MKEIGAYKGDRSMRGEGVGGEGSGECNGQELVKVEGKGVNANAKLKSELAQQVGF